MLVFAGWVNRHQQDVIEYRQEENRVLREQLGGKRLRFTDRQRRRLAAKAKAIGRKGLFEMGTLVTPEPLFRWYRRLIAPKYDGSQYRRAGRPRTSASIEELVVRMARENSTWGYTRIRDALYNGRRNPRNSCHSSRRTREEARILCRRKSGAKRCSSIGRVSVPSTVGQRTPPR